jgi:TRAP transporter 4TM/12TM fusion protein
MADRIAADSEAGSATSAVLPGMLPEGQDELALEGMVRRSLGPGWTAAVRIIAAVFCLFHLYTAYAGTYTALIQRGIHLAFAIPLVLICFPVTPRARGRAAFAVDVGLAILAVVPAVYLIWNFQRISEEMGNVVMWDTVMGAITTLLVLEASRRVLGLALPILGALSVLYAFGGPYFPEMIAHRGYSLGRTVDQLFLTTEGIYGIPLGVSATFVILFIIFGAFIQECGGGPFIINLALAIFGRVRGGAAKAAVVGSGLFGMISGSAVANVAAVGTFTIPLMKRAGYKGEFAAGVEAVGSVGGQIMPPVMGAAAFIMADMLGVSYWSVCVAAAIPAVLYYSALFMSVHFRAVRENIAPIPRNEVPALGAALRDGWHLLVGPIVLIVFLAIVEVSAMKAAFWGIVATVIASTVRASTRMTPRQILIALEKGAMGTLQVAMACACAGIVVGAFTLTGLGLRMSGVLVDLAGGSVVKLLVLTMIASLILGTGLPTTPTYILLVILVAPALAKMGVSKMAAHLFVFYYGCLADLTPPTMITVYTGAAMARAKAWRVSIVAMTLSLVGFLLPYMFAFNPAYIFRGTWAEIAEAGITGFLGVTALAAGLQGCLVGRATRVERAILLAAACLFVLPRLSADLVALALVVAVGAAQWMRRRAAAVAPAAAG